MEKCVNNGRFYIIPKPVLPDLTVPIYICRNGTNLGNVPYGTITGDKLKDMRPFSTLFMAKLIVNQLILCGSGSNIFN